MQVEPGFDSYDTGRGWTCSCHPGREVLVASGFLYFWLRGLSAAPARHDCPRESDQGRVAGAAERGAAKDPAQGWR